MRYALLCRVGENSWLRRCRVDEALRATQQRHHNNQWMVVDYKLFVPGQPLPDGLLWVGEQIPGQMPFADMTPVCACCVATRCVCADKQFCRFVPVFFSRMFCFVWSSFCVLVIGPATTFRSLSPFMSCRMAECVRICFCCSCFVLVAIAFHLINNYLSYLLCTSYIRAQINNLAVNTVTVPAREQIF